MVYVERLAVPQGVYSGYVKEDPTKGQVMHGLGTLTECSGLWRMEGFWFLNEAFVSQGVKEFADGDRYEGQFKANQYDGKVSLEL